ncbi:hypothetical protein [Alkalibacterium sp. MB6]|uniref:hypothetical protein n=1 Tax=Alkalibacterium sp. MB6 TaxID=2081965 RepID=UPI00137A0EE8|nr:hypothetical protein [Alkalibacterium sp. MB6]
MNFLIVWIVQMAIFFMIISFITLALTKFSKKSMDEQKKENQRRGDSIERSYTPPHSPTAQQTQHNQNRRGDYNPHSRQVVTKNQTGVEQISEPRNRKSSMKAQDLSRDKALEDRRLENRSTTSVSSKKGPLINKVASLDPYSTREEKSIDKLTSKNKLRQAIIYKEILDKPLAIRDEPVDSF